MAPMRQGQRLTLRSALKVVLSRELPRWAGARVAYAEIHDDETATTAIGVLRRAVAWFAARGVTVQRVLSDNGSAYRSRAWRAACAELGIKPKRTRP
jgi:transposase InsO family protein